MLSTQQEARLEQVLRSILESAISGDPKCDRYACVRCMAAKSGPLVLRASRQPLFDHCRRVTDRIMRDLALAANRVLRVNCLPDEILCEIFAAMDWPSIVRATHACRHWRAVGLSAPQLWKSLVLVDKDADALPVLLARSGGVPLDIDLHVGCRMREMGLFIGQALHRASYLIIRGGFVDVEATLAYFCICNVPFLVSLSVVVWYKERSDDEYDDGDPEDSLLQIPNSIFAGAAPRLTTVSFENLDGHIEFPQSVPAFSGVTNVTYAQVYWEKLTVIFELFPQMSSLCIAELQDLDVGDEIVQARKRCLTSATLPGDILDMPALIQFFSLADIPDLTMLIKSNYEWVTNAMTLRAGFAVESVQAHDMDSPEYTCSILVTHANGRRTNFLVTEDALTNIFGRQNPTVKNCAVLRLPLRVLQASTTRSTYYPALTTLTVDVDVYGLHGFPRDEYHTGWICPVLRHVALSAIPKIQASVFTLHELIRKTFDISELSIDELTLVGVELAADNDSRVMQDLVRLVGRVVVSP